MISVSKKGRVVRYLGTVPRQGGLHDQSDWRKTAGNVWW